MSFLQRFFERVGKFIHSVAQFRALFKPRRESTSLTKSQAISRASQIGKVHYELYFSLTLDDDYFVADTEIEFDVVWYDAENPPFLDFLGGKINEFEINGGVWRNPARTGARIYLPDNLLQKGRNRLRISYIHDYGVDGQGFHRFKDPVDNNIYLYSNAEPYSAREIFPCFDQPDLKATFKVRVDAPDTWEVIANSSGNVLSSSAEVRQWEFDATSPICTYVWALHAGPYARWDNTAALENGASIPLRLFARQSVKQCVDHDKWFQVTVQGFRFYTKMFGVAYPFGKYDQVIAPDFSHPGVENVGAVLFSESLISASLATEKQILERADIILHELAHSWFGNLVSIKWWDDLWLKESFACFSSSWAISSVGESFGVRQGWDNFFVTLKQGAYRLDNLATRHSVVADVSSTSDIYSVFDGIAYGKGGSAIKQLFLAMGEDRFTQALRAYLSKFAYKNVTRDDFLSVFAEYSGVDLTAWGRCWLSTSGVDGLRIDWACEDRKVSQFNLVRSNASEENISRHSKLALFYRADNGLLLADVLKIEMRGERLSLPGLKGCSCPVAVLPNFDDYDYVNVVLDPVTCESLKSDLGNVADPFARLMFWYVLYEMMCSRAMSAEMYCQMLFGNIHKETSSLILDMVLSKIYGSITDTRSVASRASVVKFLPVERREEFLKKVEALAFGKFAEKNGCQDIKSVWFEAALVFLNSSHAMEKVHGWLAKDKVNGLRLDRERRWKIVLNLARNGFHGIQKLIAMEQDRDVSGGAANWAMLARVASPGAENKRRWFTRILALDSKEERLSFDQRYKAMIALQAPGQEKDTAWLATEFFRKLPELVKREDELFLKTYSHYLFPACPGAQVAQVAEEYLSSWENAGGYPASLLNNIRNGIEETRKCILR